MVEIYKEGVHHLAKLDKWNYVVYDVRTLRVVGEADSLSEAYDYKYYHSLKLAVRAFARRRGCVGSDGYNKALDGARRASQMDAWCMANGSTVRFIGTDEETVVGGEGYNGGGC